MPLVFYGYVPVTCNENSLINFGLKDWHPLTWLYLLSNSQTAIGVESWGWFLEWTPAFIGSGMLVGLNVAISYMMGSFLAWYALIHLLNFIR